MSLKYIRMYNLVMKFYVFGLADYRRYFHRLYVHCRKLTTTKKKSVAKKMHFLLMINRCILMFYGDVLRTCKLMLVSIGILEIFERNCLTRCLYSFDCRI